MKARSTGARPEASEATAEDITVTKAFITMVTKDTNLTQGEEEVALEEEEEVTTQVLVDTQAVILVAPKTT